jgi:uncharacterized protein (DUF433 family)
MKFIEINPKVMLGKPVIKGTRITVEHTISLVFQDISIAEILYEYKGFQKQHFFCLFAICRKYFRKNLYFRLK